MRNLLFLITLVFIVSCQNSKTKLVKDKNPLPVGVWYYKDYIDSTVLTKTIHPYSWTCASFAYEITMDDKNPDSCYFKGYHEQWMIPLKRIDSKMFHAGEDTSQYWILTFANESLMTLKEYRDKSFNQPADPRFYTFEKRTNRIDDIKKYFATNILSGTYRDSTKEITLTDNYELIGLDSFVKYDVELDFWEMVPQMDLVYFIDKNEEFTRYNWTFQNNILILKTVKNVYKDGDWDGGVADRVAYKFEKIK